MLSETIKPLEPHERIELELFRRCLQDAVESDVTGSDIAQLMNTATDLLASGAMGKDDAIRGLVHCLIVRVKSYRDECLAHRKEAEQWHAKWQEALLAAAKLSEARARACDAATELRAFVGVMCGHGPDSILPETITTPLGVPVKVRAICADFDAALSAPPVPGENKPTLGTSTRCSTCGFDGMNHMSTAARDAETIRSQAARIAELEAEVNDFHHHLQQLCHAVSDQQFTVNSRGWADIGKPTEYAKGGARRHQYDLIEKRLKAAYDFMEPKPHPKNIPTPAEKPNPLSRPVTVGEMLRLADNYDKRLSSLSTAMSASIRFIFAPQGAEHVE